MCTEFHRKRFDVEFEPSSVWNVNVDQRNAGPNFTNLGRDMYEPNFIVIKFTIAWFYVD